MNETPNILWYCSDLVPTLYESLGMEIPFYVQGKSLVPLMKGESPLHVHREHVRTEFFGAIDHSDQTHATMYRDRKWKFINYHSKDLFELYDLENDPWEHHDLSEDPGHQSIKWDLMRRSFDTQRRSASARLGRFQRTPRGRRRSLSLHDRRILFIQLSARKKGRRHLRLQGIRALGIGRAPCLQLRGRRHALASLHDRKCSQPDACPRAWRAPVVGWKASPAS